MMLLLLMQMHELQNLYVYLTQHDEWHVKNEQNQRTLTSIQKHEHEHGMELVMMWLVHGLVITDIIKMETNVNLTDDEVEDHEVVNQKMIVQMEINHLLVMMEHVMLQVEDEMMKK